MNTTINSKYIYQQVTDAVIEYLENGNIIRRQSWNSFGLPKNITTNKQYRGWNVFWLNFHSLIKGYKRPFYLTFNQAKAFEGSIRKGEKGTGITYWATVEDKRTLKSGYITELNVQGGEYIAEGGTAIQLADLSTLWVEAQIYTSQYSLIERKGAVTVHLPDIVLTYGCGDERWGWSNSLGTKRQKKMATIGIETNDRVEITSGLSTREAVVTRGAYLINNESIFKSGGVAMTDMKM